VGLLVVVLLVVTGGTAAAVIAGTKGAGSRPAHARNPTFLEREGITQALPTSFTRDPVACVYLQVRVSSDGRFSRAGAIFLNAAGGGPCVRYASNGPDWLLGKRHSRWKIIGYTSGASEPPRCSLGIPKYLLVRPCRR
jgi:hypothetical protein